MLGLGAAAVWVAPLFGERAGAALLVGAGVDGYATTFDYRITGVPQGTTARVTGWAGVGLAAELWR